MNIFDEFEVKIEKMLYEGKSIARVDNFPVFIEGGCPEDIVKIKIIKLNKKYALGEIVEIITRSKYRVKPICALHNVCGSCNWQHINYDEQLRQKQNIIFETIKSITGNEYEIHPIIASPKTTEYRFKVQYPVSQTKVSKRLLSGYYKKNSHELVNIKFCPMHKECISEIVEYIKDEAQKLKISAYNEKNHTGLLRHIVIRQSSFSRDTIVIFVINTNKCDKNIIDLSKNIMSKFPIIKGVCANYNDKKSNVILSYNTQSIVGNDYYIENLNGKLYKISANSFFQVNPACAVKIFDKVKELINNKIQKPTILDAYSGVSSFGIWLSDIAQSVTCIEEVVSASNDAIENVKLNKINNIKIINGDAAEEFSKLIKNGVKFDVSVIDPPRKGCSEEAIDTLVKLTNKYIVYVSCNVSTLARDMIKLSEYGYNPVYIQGADMFPNTYHIETIAFFEKA